MTTYLSQEDKSQIEAVFYIKTHESSHRYLAYRDIPSLLEKYSCSGKALDYGSGTGYSSKFLQDMNFDVVGVDVSLEMLLQSRICYPNIPFSQVKNQVVPFNTSEFDFIFSSFVLFEIGTNLDIISYLKEANRLLKNDGLFLAITGSQNLHCPSRKWLNFNSNFEQNNHLTSGSLAKLYLYDANIEFTDYYWTEQDYRKFFIAAEFELLEVYYPLGLSDEPYSWKDEILYSPFTILVAKKK